MVHCRYLVKRRLGAIGAANQKTIEAVLETIMAQSFWNPAVSMQDTFCQPIGVEVMQQL